MQESISSEFTCGILEQTPVILVQSRKGSWRSRVSDWVWSTLSLGLLLELMIYLLWARDRFGALREEGTQYFRSAIKGPTGSGQCCTCWKLHGGFCHTSGIGCCMCGRIDHVSKDCPNRATPLRFLYHQIGHKRVVCPMRRGGAVSALARLPCGSLKVVRFRARIGNFTVS